MIKRPSEIARILAAALVIALAFPVQAGAAGWTDNQWILLGGHSNSQGLAAQVPSTMEWQWTPVPGWTTNLGYYSEWRGFTAPITNTDYGYCNPTWGTTTKFTAPTQSKVNPSNVSKAYAFVAICESNIIASAAGADKPDYWTVVPAPVNMSLGKSTIGGTTYADALDTTRFNPQNLFSEWQGMRQSGRAGWIEKYDQNSTMISSISRVVIAALWDEDAECWYYGWNHVDICGGNPILKNSTYMESRLGTAAILPACSNETASFTKWQQVKYPTNSGPAKLANSEYETLGLSGFTLTMCAETYNYAIVEGLYEQITDLQAPTHFIDKLIDDDLTSTATVDTQIPEGLLDKVQTEVTSKIQPAVDDLMRLIWPLTALVDLKRELVP